MAEDQATRLSQAVEREVRMTIGDLTMQTIVLRQMLELAGQQPGQQPQPQPGQPKPPVPPQPIPPQPEQDPPLDRPERRANGGFPTRGA
jgi:hypothetical protein